METLMNKTARVISVNGLMLIPGVAKKVGDINPLLSLYPRFVDMVKSGEVVVLDKAVKPAKKSVESGQEEGRPRRRAARKKE